jgi:hypothetical protein
MAQQEDGVVKQKTDIKRLNNWVKEAQWASSEWRAESWRDEEMMDGGDAQWSQEDTDDADDAGIRKITINRTFPTINYVLGYEVLNKFDIIASGRSKEDTDLSQIVTEGIKYVIDQNDGAFLISDAFRDQVVAGFGCLSPCLNPDPRKETLALKQRDWKETWWDPFAKPWFDPNKCRYVFNQPWIDLEDLLSMFPERANEINDKYNDLSGGYTEDYSSYFGDEANLVEEEKRLLASIDWTDDQRKRIRPVELWYAVNELAHFAVFADGRAIELRDDKNVLEQYAIVSASQQVVATIIRKIKVCTFVDDLMLIDSYSPYPHDQYPFVPFIAYVDRWGFPYGIPRQIRGQDEEINKRRSMALKMLNSRRVIAEKGAAKDAEEQQQQYEEAQKFDGYVVVEDGAISGNKFQIVDEASLSAPQMAILQADEQEVREITGQITQGVIAKSNPISGRAIDKSEGSTVVPATAKLFQNFRRALKMLGEQTVSNMQGFWTHEKVLRITDNFTGSQRFEVLNQKVLGESGAVEVKNNISQSKFDMVVSDAPQTDTIREKNLDLLTEWTKKSPPEAIGPLMQAAFELSSIPNKEQLLLKLKPLLGGDPTEEDLSPAQLKEKVLAELDAQQKEQQQMRELAKADAKLELLTKEADILKKKAEIARLRAEAVKKLADVDVNRGKLLIEQQEADTEEAVAVAEIAQIAHEISQPVTEKKSN